MCNRFSRVAAYALAGALTIMGTSVTAFAFPNDNTLAGTGTLFTNIYGQLPDFQFAAGLKTQEEENATIQNTIVQNVTEQNATEQNASEQITSDENAEEVSITVLEGSMAAANVQDYVNIRNAATEEGEILGKLYSGGVATILGHEGDWFQVSSGTVCGYIKGEYLIYGEEAKPVIEEAKLKTAKVNTETLHVRQDADLEAPILDSLTEGEQVPVEESIDGWDKVTVKGQTGYISTDYVSREESYQVAESKEEEEARLAVEAESRHENLRQEIISYAKQFVGNPYVWGGTSLTNGADCSGFVQSVYAHFGYKLPRDSRSQAAGAGNISENQMQPGDLLFYSGGGSINHVAIYIGNGQVVHASNPKSGIRISNYNYRSPVKVVSYL